MYLIKRVRIYLGNEDILVKVSKVRTKSGMRCSPSIYRCDGQVSINVWSVCRIIIHIQ